MADSGKKRKRPADGSSKPSKKVAIQAPSITSVTVSAVPNEDDWAPVVVSMPGLGVPDSITFKPYSKDRKNAPSRAGHSGTVATNEMLLQSSDHTAIDYVGREEEAGGVDSLLKHYVGVYDPTSGKLQIMEARKMTIRGIVRAHQAEPESFRAKVDYMNMRDLRNDLGQTFGTKKARKAIASITENAINSGAPPAPSGQRIKHDAVSSKMLESFAEASKDMATRDQLQAVVDAGKPRPKANLTAKHVNDVYTPESIIGKDILKLIPVKEWQDSVKNKKEILTKSKFVANRIKRLVGDVQKLKTLRYLLCVLDFFRATKTKGRGMRVLPMKRELQACFPDLPDAVLESMKSKFTDGAGQMPKFQVDLLMTTVCALALIIDNFVVDTYELREELQLEAKEMRTYFQEIGAKLTAPSETEQKKNGWDKAAAAQHQFAKLKLPLEFPKAKYARAKK